MAKDKKKIRGVESRAPIVGVIFASPWIIGFCIFTVYALIASFYYSFTRFSPVLDPQWIGFENYKKVFEDPLTWLSLKNTLIYTFSHAFVNISLALGMALLIKKDFHGKAIVRVIFFMPSVKLLCTICIMSGMMPIPDVSRSYILPSSFLNHLRISWFSFLIL